MLHQGRRQKSTLLVANLERLQQLLKMQQQGHQFAAESALQECSPLRVN